MKNFKLDSKQGHFQFSSTVNGHAIFHYMIEESHSMGKMYKEKELDPVNFIETLIKKTEKNFLFLKILK